MVLVNLYHAPYGAAIDDLPGGERVLRTIGERVRFPGQAAHAPPHGGDELGARRVDLDVVQRLLGHASLSSTGVYLHASDEDKRRAVEAVAAGERYQ